jgi:predicted Zn-dependent protease
MRQSRTSRAATRSIAFLVAASLALLPASPPPAEAAGNKAPPIIRDAEIETTIREFTDPVFVAAGLDINAVHVYLLGVDDINAFVAGGMNVFIYTGLLVRTQSPNQLVGVVAHETGHIAGGHLARVQEALRNATIEAIIGMVLGGVASAAGGGGGAGILVGPGAATQSMLQYTRTMEASADAAAMGFLDKTHQSSRGLLEFFQILEQMEHTFYGKQNPYLNNHPLTESRIANVQAHIATSPYSDVPDPPASVVAHKRMDAKLVGYLYPVDQVLLRYPESDKSVYGRYARSIAYFRIGQLQRALPEFWLVHGFVLFGVDGSRAELPDSVNATSARVASISWSRVTPGSGAARPATGPASSRRPRARRGCAATLGRRGRGRPRASLLRLPARLAPSPSGC